MKHHIQMTIANVLKMLEDRDEANRLEIMFEIPAEDIHLQCRNLLEAGKLYLPTEGCTTADPTGKCHGHAA